MISAVILTLAGCGANEGGKAIDLRGRILPKRIENLTDKDVIPEGSEAAWEEKYDATAFNERMLTGTWKRTRAEGGTDVLEVPAPSGSAAETLRVNAFPKNMIFSSAERTEEREVFLLPLDDYTYLQAEYELAADPRNTSEAESGDQDISDSSEAGTAVPASAGTCEFRMLCEMADQLLAVGFTGETTDEDYYNDSVDVLDIQEFDYEFSWTGCELTLSYEGASAVYVPATFHGDMQAACDGFSGTNSQTGIPGWQMSPLTLSGDGSGTISTYYDDNIPMHYSFDEDGSFSVVMENGEAIKYDTYWYSDGCLTLGSGDYKIMYQSSFYVIDGDNYSGRNSIYTALMLAGKDLPTPYYEQVKKLVDEGYKTDVDLDKTVIPSGCVSPAFKLRFRTSEVSVRAFNPTDLDLPLRAAIVCGFRISDEAGKASLRIGSDTHRDYMTCGETTREELLEYGNIFPVNENFMVDSSLIFGHLFSSDFSEYGANVLEEFVDIESDIILRFEMEGSTLHAIDCYITDIVDHNLICNMENEKILNLSPEEIEATCSVRDELAEQIRDGLSLFSDVTCDEFGAVYIPWSRLFPYGEAELSEEGKAYLDRLYASYSGIMAGAIQPACIEIGAYARYELKENGVSFTEPRAKAVCDYLNALSEEEGQKFTFRGYMGTDYLKGPEVKYVFRNLVSIRFFLDPQKSEVSGQEIDLIYKKTENQAAHRMLDLSANTVGRRRAEFAAKYKGSYEGDVYRNEAIGMKWELPEGWHFYDDDELQVYNGATAEELLLNDEPIYIFGAVNEDYDTMLDVRLCPCDGDAYEDADREIADSFFRAYETTCRTGYKDVETQEETVSLGGREVKKGTFRFTAEDVQYVRKQYYLVFEDAAVVITFSGLEDTGLMDAPGIGGT